MEYPIPDEILVTGRYEPESKTSILNFVLFGGCPILQRCLDQDCTWWVDCCRQACASHCKGATRLSLLGIQSRTRCPSQEKMAHLALCCLWWTACSAALLQDRAWWCPTAGSPGLCTACGKSRNPAAASLACPA